jgi:hypothetical protein
VDHYLDFTYVHLMVEMNAKATNWLSKEFAHHMGQQ